MATDAKENQQPQGIEERLARLEKTVDLLHERADNFDVIWQLMKDLADAHGAVLNLHKAEIEALTKMRCQEINPNKAPQSQEDEALAGMLLRLADLSLAQARAVATLASRIDQLVANAGLPKSSIN